MTARAWTTGFCGRSAVIAAVILTAAIGFCLFDGDHDGDDHVGSVDLCGAMLPATFMPVLLMGLFVAGATVLLTGGGHLVTVPLGVPHPPPKPVFFR